MMSLNNKRTSHVDLVYNCNCPLVVYREAIERLFGYAENLTAASKERYKVCMIGGLDPFLKDETSLIVSARALRTVIAA